MIRDNIRTLNPNFETMAWGAILIWWGVAELGVLPRGLDAIGFGLILLGLNVARSLNGIPTRAFTTVLGVLALMLGGLALADSILNLPSFEAPILAVVLMVMGVMLLMRELRPRGKNG